MIKKVLIIDKSSKQIIAEYPIELFGVDFKDDYFAAAWKNAVDTGLVDKSKSADYEMKFSPETPVNQ